MPRSTLRRRFCGSPANGTRQANPPATCKTMQSTQLSGTSSVPRVSHKSSSGSPFPNIRPRFLSFREEQPSYSDFHPSQVIMHQHPPGRCATAVSQQTEETKEPRRGHFMWHYLSGKKDPFRWLWPPTVTKNQRLWSHDLSLPAMLWEQLEQRDRNTESTEQGRLFTVFVHFPFSAHKNTQRAQDKCSHV